MLDGIALGKDLCAVVALGIAQVRRLLQNPAMPGVADQIDLLAQAILCAGFFGIGEDTKPGPVRQLFAAEAWMRSHFHEPIHLKKLVARFGFSEPTFRRLWKQHFPDTPWQHMTHLRMQEAQRLLRERPDLSIGEVANRCGFTDQRNFATAFRRTTGAPPGRYRAAPDR